jgi:hypothetical protein
MGSTLTAEGVKISKDSNLRIGCKMCSNVGYLVDVEVGGDLGGQAVGLDAPDDAA